MTTLLRVLNVEDSEDDAQLILRQLRSGGYDPRWERVDTPEAMTNSLDREQWDVIICDYKMPRFSAPAALKLVQEREIDIPFIIVSGTIGEDTAVAMMKAGAHDYLMKDNLSRLVVAIEREMREASIRHEKKKAEEELQHSEQSFKLISENAHDGIVVALRNGAYIYANRRASEITGYAIDEILKTGIEGFAHPDEILKLSERSKKTLAGENVPNQYETVIIHKDGNAVPIEITSARTLWYGQVADIFVFRDITERNRYEEILRESEKRYRLLAENASDVITVMDMNARPIYTSPSITRLLGYSVEESMARGIEGSVTPESIKVATKALVDTITKEKKGKELMPVTLDLEFIRKDGSTVWVAASVAIIRGPDGRPAEILSILHDISERKRAQEELIKHKDHLEELVKERTAELDKSKVIAEEANKAKSDFLANMSHEIRTPLSTVIGFSELLFDEVNGPLNDNQKKYLGYVTSSGHHLLSLINDILDLSKVEAGKMELQPNSFSISDLLKNSFSFIVEKALEHNIRLLSEISADVDVIEADERKLKQIIYNLLSNAVKFTPDGGSITVGADIVFPNSAALPIKIRKGLPDTEYVLVSVKDTGIGISKKDYSKLFIEFCQIENTYTKKYEGTGLGLALSKKLVTLHGGKIWFESAGRGKGCTFYFLLPLTVQPKVKRRITVKQR